MNKKILAVAIAGVIATPLVAQADEGNVTLYGAANVSIDFIDNGDFDGGEGGDDDDGYTDNVSSNQSVFGVKGWEPLGNGLKAVFLFDTFLGLDNGISDIGGGSFFGGCRDCWAGLAGNFGTVALGAQGRPWKTATNDVDIFVNTIADYAGIIGTVPLAGVAHDTGIGNSLIWFGPNINGLSWHLQVGADEDDDNDREYGAQANYRTGPFYATLAYDLQQGALGDDDGDVEAYKASLSYTFLGSTTISGIYDVITDDGIGLAERDAFWVGLAHVFGNNTFKLAYASADSSDAADDADAEDGADFYAIGLSHALSKRTEIYGLYAKSDNDDFGLYGLGFPNATSASSSGASNPADLGEDVDAFSIGFKHNF